MKIKITFSAFFILGLTVAAHSAYADFDEAHWQYRAKIFSGLSAPAYVTLELTPDIFSRLKPDLSDLRIVAGSEVPYVLAQERASDSFQTLSARMFNLSSVPGVSTSFVIDLGQSDSFSNSFSIDTSSENFRRIVEVRGSDDKTSWRVLNSRGQIYDYTVRDIKPISVKDTNVTYPDVTFRYLEVTIRDQGESPLAIRGVRVYRRVATAAHEVSYQPPHEVSQNSKERSTEVTLDMGARGTPHRRAAFSVTSANFHRAVAIYASDDKNDWQLLTHGYIFSIDTPKFRGDNLTINYPETSRRYIRFSVLNGDDQPISIKSARIYGVVRSVLFRIEQGKDYYVFAGNRDARRPQYDFEKISTYVDAFDRVSSGPVEENPAFKPIEPPPAPLSERSPYLLPLLLGFVVAVLAFLLLRLVMKGKISTPPAG